MSSDDKSDQRRHHRAPVRLIVDYDDANDFIKDYTENLSTGGTFILTNRTFERDTTIQLVLSFPGLVQPLALEGIVRWARGGAHPGIGVEFICVEDRSRLESLVAAVEAGDVRTVTRVVRVLVAEDNPHVAELICSGLGASAKRLFGDTLMFQCATAPTGANALELLRTMTFDVAIIDLYMPLVDGSACDRSRARRAGPRRSSDHRDVRRRRGRAHVGPDGRRERVSRETHAPSSDARIHAAASPSRERYGNVI